MYYPIKKILKLIIAAIWLINGLLCKVFNFVPRHQQIVADILGADISKPFTIIIGIAEVIMSIWILTGWKPRLNAITQIIVITTMNILEFIMVPELLLWGKWNLVWALLLILIIYFYEFRLNEKPLTD